MHISWKKYNDNLSAKPPRALLVEAVTYAEGKGKALDIGAGSMMSSKFLLENGFEYVIAIDSDTDAPRFAKKIKSEKFHFVHGSISNFTLKPSTYDFINAEFSLPFLSQDEFENLFPVILNSLTVGGIFTGQLFGDRDAWNKKSKDRIFHSKNKIEKLFANVKIHKLWEEEADKKTALGTMKHWHTFHFIVEKQ